jgi:hypothetical protein
VKEKKASPVESLHGFAAHGVVLRRSHDANSTSQNWLRAREDEYGEAAQLQRVDPKDPAGGTQAQNGEFPEYICTLEWVIVEVEMESLGHSSLLPRCDDGV